MSLLPYLELERVLFFEEEDKDEILLRLVSALHKSKKLMSKRQFYEAILKRERLVSTNIGYEIAIPHAKLVDCAECFIAMGIHKKGVHWTSLNNSIVKFIFMIGGNENSQACYLDLLSYITNLLGNSETRKKILALSSSQEVLEFFNQAQKPSLIKSL